MSEGLQWPGDDAASDGGAEPRRRTQQKLIRAFPSREGRDGPVEHRSGCPGPAAVQMAGRIASHPRAGLAAPRKAAQRASPSVGLRVATGKPCPRASADVAVEVRAQRVEVPRPRPRPVPAAQAAGARRGCVDRRVAVAPGRVNAQRPVGEKRREASPGRSESRGPRSDLARRLGQTEAAVGPAGASAAVAAQAKRRVGFGPRGASAGTPERGSAWRRPPPLGSASPRKRPTVQRCWTVGLGLGLGLSRLPRQLARSADASTTVTVVPGRAYARQPVGSAGRRRLGAASRVARARISRGAWVRPQPRPGHPDSWREAPSRRPPCDGGAGPRRCAALRGRAP